MFTHIEKIFKFLTTLCIVNLLITSQSFADPKSIGTVLVCGDGSGWPPYHYKKSGEFKGYDLDILDLALKETGTQYVFEMPPWARCLSGLETGKYHLAVSSSFNEERSKKYLMTEYYYELNPYYFYSKAAKPNGIKAETINDLKNMKTCGLRGYNYSGFGFNNDEIDMGTGSFEKLVQKITAKRCDIFVARFQIIKGFDLIDKPVLIPDIAYAAIPGTKGDKFYMLISRKFPKQNELKATLDKNFKSLRASGKLDELLKKYL